jgi:hypothetical protein
MSGACRGDQNLGMARYELQRALIFGNDTDVATWARRWGEDLIAVVDDEAREVTRLSNYVAELQHGADGVDTLKVEEALDGVEDAITDALHELGLPKPLVSRAIEHLNDGREEIKRAGKELEKL